MIEDLQQWKYERRLRRILKLLLDARKQLRGDCYPRFVGYKEADIDAKIELAYAAVSAMRVGAPR